MTTLELTKQILQLPAYVVPSRAMLSHLGPMFGPCWAMLGPSWAHLGPIWGLCWAHVAPMLTYVGPMLAYLGRCCAYVGPMLASVGPRFAYVGPMLGQLGGYVGHRFGICWRSWAVFDIFRGFCSLSTDYPVIYSGFCSLCSKTSFFTGFRALRRRRIAPWRCQKTWVFPQFLLGGAEKIVKSCL